MGTRIESRTSSAAHHRHRRLGKRSRLSRVVTETLENRQLFNAYVVTLGADLNTGDTLRSIINQANTSGQPATITFAAGNTEIDLNSDLPAITVPVTINGATSGGANGDGTRVLIKGNNHDALTITAGGSTIENLWFGACADGVTLSTNGGNVVRNCYFGDVLGDNSVGQNYIGIHISAGSSNNTIGGTAGDGSDRNVISGNSEGINIDNSDSSGVTGNQVIGNYIGLDPTGATAHANSYGVLIAWSDGNTIGGTTAAARNVISGNSYGVQISSNFSIDDGNSNLIEGNYIGTNAAGTAAVANSTGILIENHADTNHIGNTIGGASSAAANFITGNSTGISVSGDWNSIQGNIIGNLPVAPTDGSAEPGNTYTGISLSGSNNNVGGVGAGQGNLIVHTQSGPGVLVNYNCDNNQIAGNSIFDNGVSYNGAKLGIDLNNDGVTANDSAKGDGDTGGNGLQNFPVLTGAVDAGDGTNLTISGTFNSNPNTQYRLDFYTNDADKVDPSNFGEGQTYVGSITVTTDGSGDAVSGGVAGFSLNLSKAGLSGKYLTATATNISAYDATANPDANATSEFAQDLGVGITPPVISVSSPAAVNEGSAVQFTITLDHAINQDVTVHYATSPGTAAQSRFDAASGTATITQGQTQTTVTVYTNEDSIIQGADQSFTLTLSSPSSNATLAQTPLVAAGTIKDDDAPVTPTLQFLTTLSVSEADGHIILTVSPTSSSANEMTVDFSTADGGPSGSSYGPAVANVNYTPVSGTLHFPANSTASQQINVPILDDGVVSAPLQFAINLSNPVNAELQSVASCIVTVSDSDAGEFPVVSVSSANAAEGDAENFAIHLSKPATDDVTINYETSSGSATEDTDFTATSGSIVIPAGSLSAVVSVPTLLDTEAEGAETFSLSLTGVSENAQLSGSSVGVGTIQDVPVDTSRTTFVRGRATFTSVAGGKVTVVVVGGGTASLLYPADDPTADPLGLTVDGSTAATAVVVSTLGNLPFTLGSVQIKGPLRVFAGRTLGVGSFSASGNVGTFLSGDLNNASLKFDGGAHVLRFGNVLDSTIDVAASPLPITVVGGNALGLRFTAGSTVAAGVFSRLVGGTVNTASFTAPTVRALVISGDLDAEVDATGTGQALGVLRASTITGSTIRTDNGSMGVISALGISGTDILAGISGAFNPANPVVGPASDTITVVSTRTFSDTRIAAGGITVAALNTITSANGGKPFGVFAHTTKIAIGVATGGQRVRAINVNSPTKDVTAGDFRVLSV
jgi:hypothetical protein